MTARTLRLPVDPSDIFSRESQASLRAAASILQAGGIVAFPTETVYGLGANALDPAAVQRIFEAKQRPNWDPLIVHVAKEENLSAIAATLSAHDGALMKAFWPGPLTLLLPRKPAVPDLVTAGRPKVGVRMPIHPIARQLIELAGLPLAAPSANSFGRISPTTAQHVLEDLDGRIDAVLDGGSTTLGLESTVIDANELPPAIYRPGMISIEQIREILPDVGYFSQRPAEKLDTSQMAGLPSPGFDLRHYAPNARLLMVALVDLPSAMVETGSAEGLTGVMLPDHIAFPESLRLRLFRWGTWNDPDMLAQRLFLGLRELDRAGVDRILCPIPTDGELGAALRDRLEKAARPRR